MDSPFSMLSDFIMKLGGNNLNENDAMTLTDSMLRTMEFEGGHKDKVYLDSEGYPTIGIGHLLDTLKYQTLPDKYKDIIWSESQGITTFLQDYLEKEERTMSKFGKKEFNKMPDDAKGVLIDLSFNMGVKKLFDKFPGFIKDLKKGNYADAAQELRYKNPDKGNFDMSLWFDQVGGDTTEEENLVRSGNRATSAYDILTSLGNKK